MTDVSQERKGRGYKLLKDVAHNIAHSFMSNLNYVDGEYVSTEIFQIARREGISHVTIDFLRAKVTPAPLATPRVLKTLGGIGGLQQLAMSRGFDVAIIRSAVLEIDFHFDQTRKLPNTNLELPSYEARSTIVDDRGVAHLAKVPEWWQS